MPVHKNVLSLDTAPVKSSIYELRVSMQKFKNGRILSFRLIRNSGVNHTTTYRKYENLIELAIPINQRGEFSQRFGAFLMHMPSVRQICA